MLAQCLIISGILKIRQGMILEINPDSAAGDDFCRTYDIVELPDDYCVE